MGSNLAWQLAQARLLRCSAISSRMVGIVLSLEWWRASAIASSSSGTSGGAGGVGVPSKFSRMKRPRFYGGGAGGVAGGDEEAAVGEDASAVGVFGEGDFFEFFVGFREGIGELAGEVVVAGEVLVEEGVVCVDEL